MQLNRTDYYSAFLTKIDPATRLDRVIFEVTDLIDVDSEMNVVADDSIIKAMQQDSELTLKIVQQSKYNDYVSSHTDWVELDQLLN